MGTCCSATSRGSSGAGRDCVPETSACFDKAEMARLDHQLALIWLLERRFEDAYSVASVFWTPVKTF